MEAKKYYRIKDVAEFLQEPASTLRYWEKEFPEFKPQRSEGGSRLYTVKNIQNFKILQYLIRTKGMRIEAAREHLQRNKNNISGRFEALEELYNLKQELENLLNALVKRR